MGRFQEGDKSEDLPVKQGFCSLRRTGWRIRMFSWLSPDIVAANPENGCDTLKAATMIQIHMVTATLVMLSLGLPAAGTGSELTGEWEVCTMEDVPLAGEGYWNGSDGSGGFTSGGAFFPNRYDPDFGAWTGWACSSMSDRTTPGWGNQYSAITGAGFDTLSSGGKNYGVAFISTDWVTMELEPVPIKFQDNRTHEVKGFYITNSTYAALAMEQGDDFSKKFGGEEGDDPDWFRVSVWGMKDGSSTDSINFYLADFRFGDNSKDYIIHTWQWVEVSRLGEVDSLMFTLASSDTGSFGMNTPAYFCLDHLYISKRHDTIPFPGDPYISEVLDYTPAPGQFINAPPWGIPASAGSLKGGVDGAMSLGAFGGSVVFRFESPVQNHPDHPYGVDFTIFGNPLTEWSEPGIVSVMKDVNGNGLPDDTWYELAGSDYFFSTTMKDYEVTYTDPGGDEAADVPWTDNRDNSGYVPANPAHTQPYYPAHDSFPGIPETFYTLEGTRIRGELAPTPEGNTGSYGRTFGYSDNRLRGTSPWTIPDNPYTPAVENSGGDAFDIDWAVDTGGYYVDLDRIDFVRVHTGVLAGGDWLGELSTEITGAVLVAPDTSITGPLECIVIRELPDTIRTMTHQMEVFVFRMGRLQPDEVVTWTGNIPGISVDENNVLTVPGSGQLTLTATLASNHNITATVSTQVDLSGGVSGRVRDADAALRVYPNPATDHFRIGGLDRGSVSLFSSGGKRMLFMDAYREGTVIDIGALAAGCYLVRVKDAEFSKTLMLIKQ
jgi:hypothetical protein